MKKIIVTLGILALSLPVARAQYDDIYYNPKTDGQQSQTSNKTSKKKEKKSYYIADFGSMDVDEYNRATDMYYETPIDTIGMKAETDPDFVYTQQIQKYYNPTIVVDNADVLEDVLNNSYGNVQVVINNAGIPVFEPIYYYPSHYYWNWGPTWTWSWGPSWTWSWGPSWAWSWGPVYDPLWGPAWGWGPGWGYPGYGPGWGYPGYGPGWGPAWGRPFYAEYNPGGHRPARPNPGWSANRPGSNYDGGYGRPGGDRHHISGNGNGSEPRPTYAGNRRGYNDNAASRQSTSTVRPGSSSVSDRRVTDGKQTKTAVSGSTVNRDMRSYNSNTSTNKTYNSNTSTNRRYNNNTSTSRSYNNNSSTSRKYNDNSSSTKRSTSNSSSNRSYKSNSSSNRSYKSNSSSNRSYNSGSRSYGGSRGGFGGGHGGGHRGGGGHRR